MNRLKKFLFNGLLLTSVSLGLRAVSVSFNVYISNSIGAEAMGLFSLISTVYGFSVTFAASGINLASTKLVSEALGEQNIQDIPSNDSIKTVMRKCIAYSLFFSTVAFAVLFFLSDEISTYLLRDDRCTDSLRILSFTLIPISLSSALSGYFSAVRKVYKNAITQLSEQLIKIAFSVYLISFLFDGTVEGGCICIAIGCSIAEILSFFFQWLMYIFEKKSKCKIKGCNEKNREVQKKLLGIAIPVAFSAYIRSALITIEHILIPRGLERSGDSKESSLAAYGTLQSMVFPIVFFPSAIISSFASLLIPEISQASAEQKKEDIERITANVFETALIFAIGCAGIMSCFAYELGNAIYPETDAGKYIKMIAPLIPVMYLDTSVDAILKGLGEQVYSMGVNIVDSLLSVILVIILLPKFGIEGYIMTVYFTETVNATLSISRLLSVTSLKPRIVRRVIKPLFCIVVASHISVFILGNFSIPFPSIGIECVVLISITVLIYMCMLGIFGTYKKKNDKPLEKESRLCYNLGTR